MKIYSTEAVAALASGDITVSGAIRFGTPEPVRLWGGYGNLVIDGEVYVGIGDRGLVAVSAGTLGTSEQGAELSLSGIDPAIIPGLDLKSLRGVSAVLRRLIFDGSGTKPLHFAVFLRGRVDRVETDETPGGEATIKIGIEGATRGLGRRSERMRTDADQRLIDPNDGSFRRISYAGEKLITWGGKPPERAGAAFGAAGAGEAYANIVTRGGLGL